MFSSGVTSAAPAGQEAGDPLQGEGGDVDRVVGVVRRGHGGHAGARLAAVLPPALVRPPHSRHRPLEVEVAVARVLQREVVVLRLGCLLLAAVLGQRPQLLGSGHVEDGEGAVLV